MAPVRILLVDDNHMGLSARKMVLEELGYRIVATVSPQEALAHFTQSPFDLVITDFKMPRMNGVELIEHIRMQQPTVPVILISGFADALGLDAANTGADVVIQKSANEVSHLVRSVGHLLKRKAPKKPAGSQSGPKAAQKKKGSAGK